MRILIILGILLAATAALSSELYIVNGKQTTKLDAVRSLINDPSTTVLRCTPQQLSERVTLITKKAKRAD